jgi:hypothetical protein
VRQHVDLAALKPGRIVALETLDPRERAAEKEAEPVLDDGTIDTDAAADERAVPSDG